ncbi:MAG: MerR family transcriptional regulator [Prolixibacteraceae bacterium]|jgi:DNA-binding transcriptional MerR regulator|nr:MerR family transcriptional regulator [Prolixibacteraceae bacterium]
MPEHKSKIEKHFYTISEVAEMFGVNASLIRFWEREFSNIKPHKNKKGNRLFTNEDIEQVRLVYHLVKERGMTLKGAQQKIKQNPDDTIQEHEIVQRLQKVRTLLLEIKEEL